MAFPTGWNRRAAITIQSTQVSGTGTLTGFAVPLFPESSNGAGDGIPYEALDSDGSNPAQNGGGDIRFSSDSAGTTQLPCEIVDFTTATDPSTATAMVWVKCDPNGSSDVTIYIWYNTSGTDSQPAVTDTYGRNNVWTGIGGSDDYILATHLSSTSPVDSSGNATLTVNGSPTLVSDGPSGLAGLDFDGSSDSIDTGITSTSETRTIIAIIKADSAPGSSNYAIIAGKNEGGQITWNHGSASFQGAAVAKRGGNWYPQSLGSLSGATIYHLAMVLDASNIYGYADGSLANSQSTSGTLSTDTYEFKIGEHATTGDKFAGRIYELLSIDIALSDDWIATFYNSINSPTTFVSVGTPQSTGATYTLAAAQGSFTLTGQATGLLASRLLSAAQGSFSLSGQAASLLGGRLLTAAQGSFSLTGQATGLVASRTLALAQGSFALTGQSAGLLSGRSLTIAQGSFSLTGNDVGLVYSGASADYTLVLAKGDFALTGQMVGALASRTLGVSQGDFNLTGQASALLSGRLLTASQGAFTLTGQSVALSADRLVAMAQGSFAVDGQIVGLQAARTLGLAKGDFTLTGEAVGLSVGAAASAPDYRTITIQTQDRSVEVPGQTRTIIVRT